MEKEEQSYFVGVRKNSNGSLDYSHALVFLPEDKQERNTIENVSTPVFSENELQSLSMQLISASEFHKKIRLEQLAIEHQVTSEQILKELREYTKSKIRERERERGAIRHYHRTSIQNFEIIAEMGRLLSRSKLKQERPELEIPKWSSSDDVMMTRDKYDSDGNMVKPGFHSQEVVGASGAGVILVFKDEIMNNNDYDAIGQYPTISDLSLQKYCEVVLVNSPQECQQVQKILSSNKLHIPVSLKSRWIRTV